MMEFNEDTYIPSRIVGKEVNGEEIEIDISEDVLYLPDANLLSTLLVDRTTEKNIIWATDNYSEYGDGYGFFDEITPERITGEHNLIIQPRIAKDKSVASSRTKENAEVFTPSWICQRMNDKVDEELVTLDQNSARIYSDWQAYVLEDRLEITCGEAPYLVSRYDATTGEPIPVDERYGLLDRKLDAISANVDDMDKWLSWAVKAYQHTYGYEWQGDSILLARENMLATVLDHFYNKFGDDNEFPQDTLAEIADIISWNIWQMDGLKFVVPGSCDWDSVAGEPSDADENASDSTEQFFQEALFTFDDEPESDETMESDDSADAADEEEPCIGCKKNKRKEHRGVYSMVMDWDDGKPVRFVDLLP